MLAPPDGCNRAGAWIASKLLNFYSDANLTHAMAFDGSAKVELTRLAASAPAISRYQINRQSQLTDNMLATFEVLEEAERKLHAAGATGNDAILGEAYRPVMKARQALGLA